MNPVSMGLVAGTIGLAAASGVLTPMLTAGGFALVTYAVTGNAGKARLKSAVLAEEDRLIEIIATLDRALSPSNYKKNEAVDKFEDELYIQTVFGLDSMPTKSRMRRRKKYAEDRLETVKEMTASRLPKNELAARMAGFATFLAPPLGVAAIGYQLWITDQDRRIDRARRDREDSQAVDRRAIAQAKVVEAEVIELDDDDYIDISPNDACI